LEYSTLGNTGLLVSRLCFGTMTFGDGRGLFKALSAVDQAGADELAKTAIDGGINFFDTADNYTEGESEKILGQSLKNLSVERQHVVIATKVYSRVGPGRNDVGASRGHIMDGESVCSCGVRLPAACYPASSAGRIRSLQIRVAPNTTFRSWIKSGPRKSSTSWLRSRKHTDAVLRVSRSRGSWQSRW
jgi:Aldo/keto reductase family